MGLGKPLARLEALRPPALGLGDAIALAGAAAVEAAGGPSIPLALGRRDAAVAAPRELGRPLSAPGDESRDVGLPVRNSEP